MNYHRERFRKLTFRALALRQSISPSSFALTKRSRSKRQLSKSFTVVIQALSTRLIKPNFFIKKLKQEAIHSRKTTKTDKSIPCKTTTFPTEHSFKTSFAQVSNIAAKQHTVKFSPAHVSMHVSDAQSATFSCIQRFGPVIGSLCNRTAEKLRTPE